MIDVTGPRDWDKEWEEKNWVRPGDLATSIGVMAPTPQGFYKEPGWTCDGKEHPVWAKDVLFVCAVYDKEIPGYWGQTARWCYAFALGNTTRRGWVANASIVRVRET